MISFCFILGNFYESEAVLLLCFALSYMIISMFFMKALYESKLKHPDYRDSVNMITRSIPFMLVGIIGVLSTYSTRLISSYFFTASVLGIIGIYTSYTAPLSAIIAAVNKYYFPTAISGLTSKVKFNSHTILLLRLLLILTLVLSIVIKLNLLSYFVPEELFLYSSIFYGMSIQFIPILVFTYYSPLLLIEKPKYMLYLNLMSLFFSITLQVLFYKVYGLLSIPYILSIIELCQVGLLLVFIYFKSSENRLNRDGIKIFTFLSICQIWLMFLL
jgi:O-antigen/teichoic acid export membrane protein